jgi:hypothetical protein
MFCRAIEKNPPGPKIIGKAPLAVVAEIGAHSQVNAALVRRCVREDKVAAENRMRTVYRVGVANRACIAGVSPPATRMSPRRD